MVEALLVLGHSDNSSDAANDKARSNDIELEEPCMKDPAVGKPISHGQILKTIKALKANGHVGFRLETMLRGSSLYVPPPPPKPEPVRPIQPTRRVFGDSLMRDQTDEYKALMARLRREEEERSYERMLRKAPERETFAQRFPMRMHLPK